MDIREAGRAIRSGDTDMTMRWSLALLLVLLIFTGCAARRYTVTFTLPEHSATAADTCDGAGAALSGPGWALLEALVAGQWQPVASRTVETWGVPMSVDVKPKRPPDAWRVRTLLVGGRASCARVGP